MATADIFTVEGRLFDITAGGTFTAGGIDLGEVLSVIPLQLREAVELLGKQSNVTPQPSEARWLYAEATLSVILAEKSKDVLALLYPGRIRGAAGISVAGLPTARKSGHTIKAYKRIVLRPEKPADNPDSFVFFPRIHVQHVGPYTWRPKGRPAGEHTEATQVTVYALLDPDYGSPWEFGRPADWPELGGGEE